MTQIPPADSSLDAPALVSLGASALVQNANRLGLTWQLILATVRDGSDPNRITAVCDGDIVNLIMVSMVGQITTGQRVYVLKVPPSGLFIVGYAATPNITSLTFDGEQIGIDHSWVPIWTQSVTNPTLNDGTLIGRYMRIGEWCLIHIRLTIGSTTTLGTGDFEFTLPFEPILDTQPIPCLITDASAAKGYPCMGRVGTANDNIFRTHVPGNQAGVVDGLRVDENTPIALWAQGDTVSYSGWYVCVPP